MHFKKNTPLVCTPHLDKQKDFYQNHFGFRTVFENEDYLGLRSQGDTCELSFMKSKDENFKYYEGGNLIFCLEVDDVDGHYERLIKEGVTMVQPPTDNPWGDRSTIAMDPIGISVYIYKEIAPAKEFEGFFKE